LYSGGPAITASTLSTAASLWETPVPVLLNTWKHHAAFLRRAVFDTIAAGPSALDELAGRLVVIGTELMDLYTGQLTPTEIAAEVLAQLDAEGRREPEAFAAWVASSGGYGVLIFADDSSRWVLRHAAGDERYVHVHPARWAPQTRRVRANVLKTAIMVLAHADLHGGDPKDLARVNAVRRDYLGLAPMGRELSGDQGLGVMIDVLQDRSK
jgi:hypothetical protein